MKVKIWGCRGSIPRATGHSQVRDKIKTALMAAGDRDLSDPTAADAFIDAELPFHVAGSFGGDTSCVQIDAGTESIIICDLGTGVRALGRKMMQPPFIGRSQIYNIFMSHLHWDHIMGFPFFAPAYMPGNVIRIHTAHPDPEATFRRQHADPNFPIDYGSLPATIEYVELRPFERFEVDGVTVSVTPQYHGGESFGYRFEKDGKTAVYSTDSEHPLDKAAELDLFIDMFRGADVVVFDAQYSLAEAVTLKKDWGHSSNVVGIDLCHQAGARRLVLFHHDPTCSDADLARVLDESLRYEELVRPEIGLPLDVVTAYDGLEIEI